MLARQKEALRQKELTVGGGNLNPGCISESPGSPPKLISSESLKMGPTS